jgi:hypothetical protein
VSIIFWTSFVARDLYKESSSTIELEICDTEFTGFALVETELRKDENVDFFVDELLKGEEDEYGAEDDADDESVVDVFGWLGRLSESFMVSFHNCLIFRSAVVRSR